MSRQRPTQRQLHALLWGSALVFFYAAWVEWQTGLIAQTIVDAARWLGGAW